MRERLFLNMCWAQVEVRLSHLIFKQCREGGGILPQLQTEATKVKFSQLVKFLNQDLNLALVEILKGTEVEAEQEVRDRGEWERMSLGGLMCAGASAHYSSSFSCLGPDPGPTYIQLWALSLESLTKILPSRGEGCV